MPITTTVPVGGNANIKRTDLGLVITPEDKTVGIAPPSFSHLFQIYGRPKIQGDIRKENKYEERDGKLIALVTFFAVDPEEQDVVDEWAAQIEEDEPEEIRTKISDYVSDQEKNINQVPDLPSHSAKFS